MLAAILPAGIAVAEEFGPPGEAAGLLPAEHDAIATAAPKRRREFASVRACARRALTELGVQPAAVLPGPSGEPAWPPGVVGSMTHCEGYRACAIGRAGEFEAIGIDAEPHAPLPDGVLGMVTSESERAQLAELAACAPGTCWDRILFCAKEAVYKAWFPATGRWLGFRDANVHINRGGSFHAQLLVSGHLVAGHELTSYDGRWQVARGLIAAAIVLPFLATRPHRREPRAASVSAAVARTPNARTDAGIGWAGGIGRSGREQPAGAATRPGPDRS